MVNFHKYGISIAKLKSLNGLKSNLIFLIKYLKYLDHRLVQQNLELHLIVVQYTLLKQETHYHLLPLNMAQLIKIMQLNGLNNYLILPGQKLVQHQIRQVALKLVSRRVLVVLQHILFNMVIHYH